MRLERNEVAARLALEAEQERTLVLVGELDRLSREDSLTGVANRRAWDEALARSCAEAERTGRSLSVLLLDIDRFKDINDEHGHRRGDEVLQEVAGCLAGRIRSADLLARVGGDEFAVLCPNTGPEEARHLADHLVELVAAMPGALTVSVGSAVRWPGAEPDAVMGLADRRLYEAKQAAERDRGQRSPADRYGRGHVPQHHHPPGPGAHGHRRGDRGRRPPVRPQDQSGVQKTSAATEAAFEKAVKKITAASHEVLEALPPRKNPPPTLPPLRRLAAAKAG